MSLGIEEAGDDAAVGDGMRTEGFFPAFALDERQWGVYIRNRNIKRHMLAAFPQGPDAPADAGAWFDQRIALLDGVDLPVENAFVELLQQLLVLAENLEMYNPMEIGRASCRVKE